MGMLIATTDPYVVFLMGFCLGVVTGISALGWSIKVRGKD